ncbi:MAG: CPBP family intramembrane metalloprotease [Chloroflexi bacterium]|nr:CPBP family intramembrane metalloprotease [Chloroflexota bacterium]
MDFRYFIGFISEWLGAISVAWILSISPRFQKPVIGFKYARRDGIVAISLFALILLFSFIFSSINPAVLPDPLIIAAAPVGDLGRSLILAFICLLTIIAAVALRRQPVRSAGWNPALITPGLQMGLAIGILTIFLRNRVMDVLSGISPEGLNMLLLALGISLAEETIFRGYIQLRLSWWLGQWTGIILTSLMFTLFHIPAWLNAVPTPTLLILAGLTFVQGLVLGWVMHKSGIVAAPALYRAFSIWVQFL